MFLLSMHQTIFCCVILNKSGGQVAAAEEAQQGDAAGHHRRLRRRDLRGQDLPGHVLGQPAQRHLRNTVRLERPNMQLNRPTCTGQLFSLGTERYFL